MTGGKSGQGAVVLEATRSAQTDLGDPISHTSHSTHTRGFELQAKQVVLPALVNPPTWGRQVQAAHDAATEQVDCLDPLLCSAV